MNYARKTSAERRRIYQVVSFKSHKTSIVFGHAESVAINANSVGGLLRRLGRIKHHQYIPAATTRAAQALSNSSQEKVSAARAHQRFEVEKPSIVTTASVPDLPGRRRGSGRIFAQGPRFAQCPRPWICVRRWNLPISKTKQEQKSNFIDSTIVSSSFMGRRAMWIGIEMRNGLLGLCTAAAVLVSGSVSHATTFTWSYTDGGSNVGSGTFEATQDLVADPGGAAYKINSVTGTAQGQTIVGLTGYGTADNYLYWQPGSPAHFDPANPYYHAGYFGVGFALAGGTYYDLYEEAGTQPPGWICGDASVPYCLLGPGTDPSSQGAFDNVVALTDFAVDRVAATPLPATLPLFASGLAGLGLLARRRKKQVA